MSFSIEHCTDSFAGLRACPSGAFDVTITDPPYDEHTHANMLSGTAVRKHLESGSGAVPRVESEFAPLDGNDGAGGYAWTADLLRVTKRWGIVFCPVEAFGDLRRLHGKAYKRGAWWYKPNAMGQLTADRPAIAGEGIACLHAGGSRWNGKGSYGFWPCNGTRGEKGRHPNQKPLDLCLKLVALFSERGETIFDPFCGSGRIGQAAVLLGRNYVGLDSDPAWVARAGELLRATAGLGGYTDEQALALCTAKKAEIVEPVPPRYDGECVTCGYTPCACDQS